LDPEGGDIFLRNVGQLSTDHTPVCKYCPKYQTVHQLQGSTTLYFTQTRQYNVSCHFFPSFLSALQLRVSFGLLNNLPPFFSVHPSIRGCLVSEQFSFNDMRLLASSLTPNLEDQGIPLLLAPTPDLFGMGDPTSSYATAGITLRVSGALKPHHHDKVETPSVGFLPLSV
jgi:hypothetical protein